MSFHIIIRLQIYYNEMNSVVIYDRILFLVSWSRTRGLLPPHSLRNRLSIIHTLEKFDYIYER